MDRESTLESIDAHKRVDANPGCEIHKYQYGPARVRESIDLSDRTPCSRMHHSMVRVVEIEYITPEGKKHKLSSYLPKGWIFRKAPGVGSPDCSAISKEVIYRDRLDIPILDSNNQLRGEGVFLEKPGSFFGLLHEIGHAKIAAKLSDKENLERGVPIFLILPEDLEEHLLKRLQEERDASAYAVSELRRLRRGGIDLEPQITTIKQLEYLITIPLTSQELEWVSRINTEDAKDWTRTRVRILRKAIKNANDTQLIHGSIRPQRGLNFETKSWRCLWGLNRFFK